MLQGGDGTEYFLKDIVYCIHRGSYISAHTSWGKGIKCEACRNKFNKFNNTGAQILDSILSHNVKFNQKSQFWHENVSILSSFTHIIADIIM